MGIQKLAITLAEQCARYAKACGKSSILHTKPVQIQSVKGLMYAKELKCDVAKFETNEIKLDSELFDFLPWRNGYKKLPPTGRPPKYTPEAKQATESFINKGWIEEPLPNGFRMPFGPYRAFDENGMIKSSMPRGGADREFLYFNEDSKGINMMVKRLKSIFSDNPNITEKQKAQVLYKFVDSCYERKRASWISQFCSDFIPIENTAASGAGVCRHKSFLAKVLGDKLGLNIAMARGRFITNTELGIGESHIWNEIKIGEKWFLMDVEQGRFEDLTKFSDFSKLYEYAHCVNL